MSLSLQIRHDFGSFSIDVGFDAPLGITTLFGPSGAGKTTVVNAVAGLLRPDEGRITLNGTTLFDSSSRSFLPPHRRRIGYVFQDARLFPHLTVRQNLRYGGFFAPRRPSETEWNRITEMLGIGHLMQRRPGALSGGEKSRVALGRAILSAPEMLLMDEPLAALDEARKAEILPYIERLRDELHLPILLVSHSAAEVARLATTIVLLREGRVLAAGPAAEVLSDPETAPGLGPREAGAVIEARFEGREADGLARLSTVAGPLLIPDLDSTPGRALRLRIPARDVMIALARPEGISALNVLPGRIETLHQEGPGAVLLRLDLGEGQHLLARVTPRSVQTLGLAPGVAVHAVLKAVTVAPESIGQGQREPG